MRTKGEGTVQTLQGGKYRGVLTVRGRRVFGPRVDRRAEALPALRVKLEKREPLDAEPPLSICVNRRIDWMISELYSPTTIDLWRAALKRIEGDRLGDLQPSEVDALELAAWSERQALASRTIKNYVDVIRRTLGLYGHKVELQRGSVDRKRKRQPKLLSPTDQKELLSASMTDEVRLMVLIGLRLGLRRSEMAGLRHEDRDGDGVFIRRAVVRATGIVAIKKTKTQSSEAWLPLAVELRPFIGGGSGFVLGDGDVPISPSVLDDRWRRFVAKHPKFRGVGLHDLRRTFGMTLLENGTDVRTAAELMRHDPAMLLTLYTRSRRDLKTHAIKNSFDKSVAICVAKSGLG